MLRFEFTQNHANELNANELNSVDNSEKVRKD